LDTTEMRKMVCHGTTMRLRTAYDVYDIGALSDT
jgi:hypothetical protein